MDGMVYTNNASQEHQVHQVHKTSQNAADVTIDLMETVDYKSGPGESGLKDINKIKGKAKKEKAKENAKKDTRFCVYCNTQKTWIFRGDKAKDGSKIYIDEKNSRWSGKRCPDCERSRVRAASKYDHFERSNIVATLKQQGYEVLSTVSPILVRKEGVSYRVAIRRAYKDPHSGGVVVEKADDMAQAELTALLFQTTKLLTCKQMQALAASANSGVPATSEGKAGGENHNSHPPHSPAA